MIEQFVAARKKSTPLIAIRTPDPTLTIDAIRLSYPEDPIFLWDCINGIKAATPSANQHVSTLADEDTTNPVAALEKAVSFPARSVFICLNAHNGVENPNWIQAVWNLRNPYKGTNPSWRTLVLLCPEIRLPLELVQDVMIIDEPLPNPEQLKRIVLDILSGAGETSPDPAIIEKAVDATCGLAAFPAEQVTAMSLCRDADSKKVSLRLDDLWSRKKQVIEQTPGLSIWRGGETFANIGGYDNLKTFLTRIVNGKNPPRGVLFMDEIEKMFAGATAGTGDTSGTSQGFLGTLLSYMQDNESNGVILAGAPGTSKSHFAKAFANTAGVPGISLDLGGMKNSLVGASEAALRNALKVVTAVTQGRAFFVASCNRISALPPELRRRFRSGTFYLDLPTPAERKSIWDLYIAKYGLDAQVWPEDTDWTGAEIRQCCLMAYELDCTLIDASQYIVPVAKSAEREIAELRVQANGRFISASAPGFYRHALSATSNNVSRGISGIDD